MSDTSVVTFGPFTLLLPQRQLTKQGEIVRLGSRAFDILVALLESDGQLVTRDDLIASVWPDTSVDESALRVHMSALRKGLGANPEGAFYVVNESGRGYRFALPFTRTSPTSASGADVARPTPSLIRSNLPGQIARILGREDVIEGLSTMLPDRRFLTIAGPGGIGKTTVAVAMAHRYAAQGLGRVVFVDFAPVTDPVLVSSVLASIVQVPVTGNDPIPDIAAALGTEPLLLLFDNCEHLVEAVAVLAERLLQAVPALQLLVTSREPLQAEGEWIYRLATLKTPPEMDDITVSEALDFASVHLFSERATAVSAGFLLTETNINDVCRICRRLDGIPLAIEFAAARISVMDARAIAEGLADRFRLLTKGRRTALLRQQTLRATLDWSYDLLDPRYQAVLRRISLFRNAFDMEAVLAVAVCSQLDRFTVFDAVTDLVAKSLVTTDISEGTAQFRLLDTTRYYGMELLDNTDERNAVKRLHALYCRSLFDNKEAAWEGKAVSLWIGRHARRIDDIRAGLDWAFSSEGDVALGLDLTVAAADLWFLLDRTEEFTRLAEQVTLVIEKSDLNGTAEQVELLSILGNALWHTRGPVPLMLEVSTKALAIAKDLGDRPLEMRSVWGVWMYYACFGSYEQSMIPAEEFRKIAFASEAFGNIQTGRNVMGLGLHFLGQQTEARAWMDDMFDAENSPERAQYRNSAQLDGVLSASGNMMRIMWIQGFTEDALKLARDTAKALTGLDHDLTSSAVLPTGPIPVAIWSGDFAWAAELIADLRLRTRRRGLNFWFYFAEGYEHLLDGKPLKTDAPYLVLDTLSSMGSQQTVDLLVERGRLDWPSFARAETIRQNALNLFKDDDQALEAELLRAIAVAEDQGALSWVLRSTISLAEVLNRQGRAEEGMAALRSVVDRFTQPKGSPDFGVATRMLAGENVRPVTR